MLYLDGRGLIKILNVAGFVTPFAECSHLVNPPHFIIEDAEDLRGEAAYSRSHRKLTELELELGLRLFSH